MPHVPPQIAFELSMDDTERQIHENGKNLGWVKGYHWGRRAGFWQGAAVSLLLNNLAWLVAFWYTYWNGR